MAEEDWTTITEFPEPSPKTPEEFKTEIFTQAALIAIATAFLMTATAEPVSQSLDLHIFEHMPECQATINEHQFVEEDSGYCKEQIEFCNNQQQCQLITEKHDRYNDYIAKLPDEISNETFRYRVRKDRVEDIDTEFKCHICHSA